MLLLITYMLVAFNIGLILATHFSLKSIEDQLKLINLTLNGQIEVLISEKENYHKNN